MSHFERDNSAREEVMSQYSVFSDGSASEDLLSKLHDFPHVPNDDEPLTAKFAPTIYEDEDEDDVLGRGDASELPLSIGSASRGMLAAPPEKEKDVGPLLDASEVLRAHPGLLMEHFDPSTNVHTFKITYPQRSQHEGLQLPSPDTPNLSNGSSTSSPLITSPQTLLASSSNGSSPSSSHILDRHESLAPNGLHRASSSASSSTSDSSRLAYRGPPVLRRRASELSDRLPSWESQYATAQHGRGASSPATPSPTQPSSGATASTADKLARRFAYQPALASPESEDASSRPVSTSTSRVPDAPQSRGAALSSDELTAFREFLTRRAEDVLMDARHLDTSPVSGRSAYGHLNSAGSFRDDTASDRSWDADSVRSGRRSSSHGHGSAAGQSASPRRAAYNRLHAGVAPGPAATERHDHRHMQEDLLRALSIIRAERERVAAGSAPLLADSESVLDLYGSLSAPSSRPQSLSTPRSSSHALPPRRRDVPAGTPPPNPPSPTATVFSGLEEMQDFLPDFLDLGPDPDDLPHQPSHIAPSAGRTASRFLERLAPVPEGSAANTSERAAERLEDDWADPVLSPLPLPPRPGPRKSHSTGELASGRPPPRTRLPLVPLAQSYAQPHSAHPDLQRSEPFGLQPLRAVASARGPLSAGAVGGSSYAPRLFNDRTSSLAEYEELAYSESTAEDYWRESAPREKPARDPTRQGDHEGRRRGPLVSEDGRPPREFLLRTVAPGFPRQRTLSAQDETESASLARHRPHRMSSQDSITPSLPSLRGETQQRMLSDRGYGRPDVPHSPLHSEREYAPSPRTVGRTVALPHEFLGERDIDDYPIRPPSEPGRASPLSRSDFSRGGSRSPNTLRSRAMNAGSSAEDTYSPREPRAVTYARELGFLTDSHADFSTYGVGLSVIDNGAFEAPRPAPEPRSQIQERTITPARELRQKVPTPLQPAHGKVVAVGRDEDRGRARLSPINTLKKPADDSKSIGAKSTGAESSKSHTSSKPRVPKPPPVDTPDLYFAMGASPMGFSAMSFRAARPKKPKPASGPKSPTGQLRAAGQSEPDFKSSFISVTEDEVKPQKRGLLFKRKKS
ncbi:hypothetical protein BC834DRAFT_968146 [Gloeopeniophorella convolvens]|nr:hypothetical protein BC834DRAFT_968146 [Gloeopeniophorella convolvens]